MQMRTIRIWTIKWNSIVSRFKSPASRINASPRNTTNRNPSPHSISRSAILKPSVILASAVACALTHLSVSAESPARFDPIIVEGDTVVTTTPWSSETTRKDLDALQILNWSDLGRRAEPGVSFSETSQSINVRGLDKNRVLTRIDGIRQTWLNDAARGVRGGLNTVDFNSLSSIDIVRGADSSQAGSGALGGVIDVKTLRPSDLLLDGRSFGSLLKGGYNSADRSWLSSAAIASQIASKTQLLLQAGVQSGQALGNQGQVDSYGLSRTQPDPDNYLQQNYQLKLVQKFEGGHTLGLSGSSFNRKDTIQNYAASPQIYQKDSSELENKVSRKSIAIDYGWKAAHAHALFDTVDVQISRQDVKLTNGLQAVRRVTPIGDYSRNNTLDVKTFDLNTTVSKAFSGDVTQLWRAGVEWRNDVTEQMSTGQDNCPARVGRYSPCLFLRTNQADMPQVQGNQFGVWVQNKLGFAQDAFTLTPGVRYDFYAHRPQTSDALNKNITFNSKNPDLLSTSSGSAVSPKLLAEWFATKNTSFYAQYAFGFNAPTATQLYSRYGSPGTYLIAGNPDLKPETSRGLELGTRLGDEKLNGSLTYFNNNYQNFIESVNRPGTRMYPYYEQTFENLDKVRIYGLEAKGSWTFTRGWRAYGSMAWSVGTNQQTGQSLNSVAPLTAIAGIGYSQESWGVQTQITATAARKAVAYPEANAQVKHADFQAPGFGVVDFTGYWVVPQVKGLKFQAGLYNVFDRKYWNASNVPTAGAVAIPRGLDLYTSPGRSVQLTMTYQY